MQSWYLFRVQLVALPAQAFLLNVLMNSAFPGDLIIRYDDQLGVSPAGAGVVPNLQLHEEVGAVEVMVETEGSVESAGDEERSHSEAN